MKTGILILLLSFPFFVLAQLGNWDTSFSAKNLSVISAKRLVASYIISKERNPFITAVDINQYINDPYDVIFLKCTLKHKSFIVDKEENFVFIKIQLQPKNGMRFLENIHSLPDIYHRCFCAVYYHNELYRITGFDNTDIEYFIRTMFKYEQHYMLLEKKAHNFGKHINTFLLVEELDLQNVYITEHKLLKQKLKLYRSRSKLMCSEPVIGPSYIK